MSRPFDAHTEACAARWLRDHCMQSARKHQAKGDTERAAAFVRLALMNGRTLAFWLRLARGIR